MTAQSSPSAREAAHALAQLIRGRSPEFETERRLPADVAAAIRSSELMRLLMPQRLGGRGGDWQSAFEALETVAQSDGASAWTLMIGMTINMLTAYIEHDQAIELFGDGAPLFFAGVFEPRGIARGEPDGAGYRLSGRWRFASGIHLSDWFCATAAVPTERAQPVRHFAIPTTSLRIHSNWDVVGLCGTGSDDVEIDALKVDKERSFTLSDTPWPQEPFWRISFFSVTAALMGAVILGIARSGLDSVIARSGVATGSISRFGRSQCLETEVARGEAMLRSARAFILECMAEVAETARKDTAPSVSERARLWLAGIHAAQASGEVLDMLFSGEGASGIRRESPLQRCWRDVRVASKHVVLARQRLEAVGRVLLGAPAEAAPFL